MRDFEQRTQKCKDNVAEIQRVMATWKTLPLHERKTEKHEYLLDLESRLTKVEKRFVPASIVFCLITTQELE